tara:strand:- start:1933 stop:2379 length:447 start_codon:yes stop_codon:yes gene_type:complete
MWAESHSYWSYYYITPILVSFILLLDHQKKFFANLIIFLVLINFIFNFNKVSRDIISYKNNPLSLSVNKFLKKYKDYDYVSDDPSIGYGFGFRSRWLENKKFFNVVNYKFDNKKVLYIRRLSNCDLDQIKVQKFEFYNWCYSEQNFLK